MGYLTSGNAIVDAMGTINITGNIIPSIWYRTVTKKTGKPYLLAIAILADIVYWYRPSEVRNQESGHIIGWKKKFSDDILRQSYQHYAELFGESKKTVKTAMDRLEELNVIRREFRTVSYGKGLIMNNVMYVELVPETLTKLTFPEENPVVNGENVSSLEGCMEKTGGSLPTKPDTPMEILGGRGIPNGIQVIPKKEIDHTQKRGSLPTKNDRGPSQKGGTNTYITTKNTNIDFNHINQEKNHVQTMDADGNDRVNEYIALIKENLEYEHHMKYDDGQQRALYEELFEIICEVVCIPREKIRVGKEDYPYEIVKSRFLKLKSWHLEYVIECMQQNIAKIKNIKNYMITALYNASITINHYYQQEVQHDMHGGNWEEKGIV